MTLILTSNFPSSPVAAVVEHLRQLGPDPEVLWISPSTGPTLERFALAQETFREFGIHRLERYEIDRPLDEDQLARLSRCDAVYLSGGDPMRFRAHLLHSGAGSRLCMRVRAGRLVVAASGGSLQLTPNVSLFRLESESLETVLATRGDHAGLGAVPYEVLPHVNRCNEAFLEKVRAYSQHVDHEIVGIVDGGALLHATSDSYQAVGIVVRFRNGARGWC